VANNRKHALEKCGLTKRVMEHPGPFSLAAVDRVLVDPAPKGAIGDTDLAGGPGDRVLLIGGSNQLDSFSAKLRWVGLVCSWQCSPFRALFSVLNSPRNRRKSRVEAVERRPGTME
jgi:hypothetical protein